MNGKVRIHKYDGVEVYVVMSCLACETVERIDSKTGLLSAHGGMTQEPQTLNDGFKTWEEAKEWCDMQGYDVVDGPQKTKRFEIK